MSFLAPLFLLGALAVALPVVFHLIRRTTREKTVAGSVNGIGISERSRTTSASRGKAPGDPETQYGNTIDRHRKTPKRPRN